MSASPYTVKCYGIPGSGKTTRLIARLRLELKNGIAVKDMAYLSFSTAAKDVIKERLRAKDSDMRWFRTIHGAAAKAMGLSGCIFDNRHFWEFEKLTGMRITPEDYDAEFGRADFNIALRALNLATNRCVPIKEVVRELPDHPNLLAARLNRFIEDYAKFKSDRGLFDYTDMLTHYDRDGEPLPVVVGMIDEAQDNSELQWRCVRKMMARCERLYLGGDEDQAIYPFVGASEYGFLDYPCDEEEILARSYRVPVKIGDKADSIIRKIARRKDKVMQWRDAPGEVSRINRDAMNMDWPRLIEAFPRLDGNNGSGPGIMVLCRHRKGAMEFSKDLKLRGIAHSLHGETMNTWPEAKILHSIYSLREGKSITAKAAIALARALGRDTSKYRDLGRRERVTEIEGVNLNSLDWLAQCATSYRTRARFQSLMSLVRAEGYEALALEPCISVSTMHGAKGKEADLVIINPECTNIVRQNMNTPTERRLAYVALTRAKEQALLLVPRSENYINHFF